MTEIEREERESEHYVRMMEQAQLRRLDLTDTEWMNIIVRERDGLPPCCANISALRDVLIGIAREDGEIGILRADGLVRALSWCFPGHDVPSPEVQKVIDQIGWEPFEGHVRGDER